MDEKQKAEELIKMFLPEIQGADRYNYNLDSMNLFIAKQCAKLMVDEIIKDLKESFEVAKTLHPHAQGLVAGSLTVWNKVKLELMK